MKSTINVRKVRRTGKGPIGSFGRSPVELIPTMHGQRFGRLATVAFAIGLAISTTGTSNFSSATEATPAVHTTAGESVDYQVISTGPHAVATPRLTVS